MAEEEVPAGEKKIIIDEDWKSRVQAEKEQAGAEPPSEPMREQEQPAAEGSEAARQDESSARHGPLPPANISFLFSTLASQAFISLGFLPHPVTDKMEVDVDQAKHFIDMLGVLEEKTKGNLTSEEKRALDTLLYDLRLQFVEVKSKAR